MIKKTIKKTQINNEYFDYYTDECTWQILGF